MTDWPRWPRGGRGDRLLDVIVSADVDTLFAALFGDDSEVMVSGWLCGGRERTRVRL